MGCVCTKQTPRGAIIGDPVPKRRYYGERLDVAVVLNLATSIVHKHFHEEVDGLMLAALALNESYGCPALVSAGGGGPSPPSGAKNTGGLGADALKDGAAGDPAVGLGQVRLSTAQWLAGVKGYSCYGSAPSVAALQSAPTSLYFAAAHLRELAASCACSLRGDDIAQAHDTSLGQAGCQQGGKEEHHEERLVKAYYSSRHKGCEPGGCEEEAEQCWQLYRRTKAQLAVLADALARSQAVPGGTAEPPVMMHVVRPGESLASLAAVCGVSVASILEANPDIGDGQLEANDCIALPVSQVLPSFRMVLPTDTLYSIAADHRCGLQRLLRHNPDMKDPQRFVPGALLALPGLRGSSMDYDADSSSQLDVGLDAPALLMMLAAARSQAAEPLAQSPLPLVTPIAVH